MLLPKASEYVETSRPAIADLEFLPAQDGLEVRLCGGGKGGGDNPAGCNATLGDCIALGYPRCAISSTCQRLYGSAFPWGGYFS